MVSRLDKAGLPQILKILNPTCTGVADFCTCALQSLAISAASGYGIPNHIC
jgi:hypothetical protein